jgi:hypothetical protein
MEEARMRLTPIVPAAALALGLFASACKKDSTSPTIALTQTEVSELFAELSAALDSANINFSRVGRGPMFSVFPGPSFSAMPSVSVTANCPAGGNVSVMGSASSTTTSETFDITEAFNSCKTTHFTVGGSIRATGSFTYTQTSISGNEAVKGSLSVNATDGRSGSCPIDFSVTFVGTSGSPTITTSGTICGISASGM